jgi:hypothetical protein
MIEEHAELVNPAGSQWKYQLKRVGMGWLW